ncbi:MAG: GyrI-like domain-containing protein [Acutalibacter sp.]|nr:GyrI-like domain-containing protein [Acutalibacter sp.]
MTITNITRENCPAARLIGKRYAVGAANWGEFWGNGWFDQLEKLPGLLDINDNGYTEAIRVVDGKPEHWLGMYFSQDTAVLEGFDCVEIPPMEYAVCYLYGDPENGELFNAAAHEQCLTALKEQGLQPKEDGWRFQRCNCPRFTTPDEQGNVTLDYGIAIQA